ncbi:MAG TPA: septal ring lytic transglycosylase RlpA family protein [Kiloniellaceae bacterium]|nr:septal ring lytic transglycosylase RlpA family protein [Kiloniellaceae bacterium]
MSVAVVRGAGIAAFTGLVLLLSASCAQTATAPAGGLQSEMSRQPVAAVPVPAAPKPARPAATSPAANTLAAVPEADPGSAVPPEPAVSETFFGNASWYGRKFHGRLTASGERYDMAALTAAHRKLPFGSRVRVTNLANGREVVVTINDRGPFAEDRLIDLSHAAARQLGILEDGVAEVRLEVLAEATDVAG